MGTIQAFFAGIGAIGAIFSLSACGFLTQAGTVLTGIEIPGPSLWLVQGETPLALDNGQHIITDQGTLRIIVKPFPARQKNKLELYFEDTNARPVDNANVTIQCDMVDMSHEISRLQLNPRGKGYYQANLELPMEGLWQLKITITRPEENGPATYVFRLRNDLGEGSVGEHFGH